MALWKVEVTRVEYGAVFGPRARPSSGGGVSLDFRSGARLKIHHQEISGLFCRLNFDECRGRFDAFHSANPAHTTLCLPAGRFRLCSSHQPVRSKKYPLGRGTRFTAGTYNLSRILLKSAWDGQGPSLILRAN